MFHISIKSHNDEVKLCDVYQFLKRLMVFARTQTSFGIGQIVYFSFINRHVLFKQILLTWFILFSISCLQTEEYIQNI